MRFGEIYDFKSANITFIIISLFLLVWCGSLGVYYNNAWLLKFVFFYTFLLIAGINISGLIVYYFVTRNLEMNTYQYKILKNHSR